MSTIALAIRGCAMGASLLFGCISNGSHAQQPHFYAGGIGRSSQPRATSSNAFFMDGSSVCAARFLASAALCRYSSDCDDMRGEHWKEAFVP
jgi:hypothetical protein